MRAEDPRLQAVQDGAGEQRRWPQGGYRYQERFHCMRIEIENEQENYQFMMVSYHAPHKQKRQRKVGNLINFFKGMCQMADRYRMPIIVGGDFNCRVDVWRPEIQNDRVIIADAHQQTPRRKGKDIIDTICIVNPDGNRQGHTTCVLKIHVIAIEFRLTPQNNRANNGAIEIERNRLEEIRANTPNAQRVTTLLNLMDHDPVIAQIQFTEQ